MTSTRTAALICEGNSVDSAQINSTIGWSLGGSEPLEQRREFCLGFARLTAGVFFLYALGAFKPAERRDNASTESEAKSIENANGELGVYLTSAA